MSQKPAELSPQPLRRAAAEVIQPLRDFVHAPRALWGIHLPYFLEGLVYFGILTVLAKFLSENVGLGDVVSGWVVALFTGGITASMFVLGEVSDRWGVRRALLASLGLMAAGRVLLASAEALGREPGLFGPLFCLGAGGLLLVVVGYGMYQPAAYAGVRELTDEKTAAMGYAMIYALMNLGAFASGLLSPLVRRASERAFPPNGISGVFWVYAGLTVLAVICTAVLLPPGAARPVRAQPPAPPVRRRPLSRQWLAEHPLADGKFTSFIFLLVPVQTLFAHNWLTMPLYIERGFQDVAWVSHNFELFANINPVLIFVLTPLVAALTARADVYGMMIVGTTVMAVPTFLLCLGPQPVLLLVYILAMSVGEAIWQPRFLQYAAELAPPGKTGMYMGVAQLPWFLTKVLTGAYSGWFLARYCPPQGPRHTEFMWLVHGLIACASPLGLLLARGWLGHAISQGGSRR
ncbi:MAG: MFS transporter [Myxococcales bacterium]|nr:MFS transporter [Myxococcota bacterium]MDW8283282.1 MFS transporter [Myxococcales bacterium]